MVTQPSALASKLPGRIFFPGRSASLSSQIVADVRDALFAKKLKPGDVHRHRERDRRALRRQPDRGARRAAHAWRRSASPRSGWARAAARAWRAAIRGCSPRRWRCSSTSPASAPAEIMDAQRAIECLAAELAAENATEADIARLRALVAEAEASIDDVARFTELGRDFHLAVAEASHNRVLVVQLISLQHVSWPRRNPTLTPKVARRILDVHKELLGADRNPRSVRRPPPDGRPRQDDPRPARGGARQGRATPSFRGAPKARTRNPDADGASRPLDSACAATYGAVPE